MGGLPAQKTPETTLTQQQPPGESTQGSFMAQSLCSPVLNETLVCVINDAGEQMRVCATCVRAVLFIFLLNRQAYSNTTNNTF